MNLRLFLSILFIYTGTYSYTQQLKLDKGPEDYQLFARDKNDSATVLFSGRVTDDAKFNELRLKVYKDGILYDNKSVKIENRGFKFSSIIQAGLFQYRFELYHQIESVEKLSFIADNVVCGDAYIITGQSNSHASSNKSSYTSPFCRSFGVKTGYEKYTDEDKKIRWGLATGNCLTCKGDGWETYFTCIIADSTRVGSATFYFFEPCTNEASTQNPSTGESSKHTWRSAVSHGQSRNWNEYRSASRRTNRTRTGRPFNAERSAFGFQ